MGCARARGCGVLGNVNRHAWESVCIFLSHDSSKSPPMDSPFDRIGATREDATEDDGEGERTKGNGARGERV